MEKNTLESALKEFSQTSGTNANDVKEFFALMSDGSIKRMPKEDMATVLGGLLAYRLIKQYTYSLEPSEQAEVECASGQVLLGIDMTNNQASFILRPDGQIYDFVSTADSSISNTDNSAVILKIGNGSSFGKMKLKNNFTSTIKVYLSVIMLKRT